MAAFRDKASGRVTLMVDAQADLRAVTPLRAFALGAEAGAGPPGARRPPPGRDTPGGVSRSAPGGPSTVPAGYRRVCKRTPYFVCDAYGCRIRYSWVCYYYPTPRVYR